VGAGKGLPKSLAEYAKPNTIVPYIGHAMEARVYAEDPLRGFLPSTGPLVKYFEPTTDVPPEKITSISAYPRQPPYCRLDSGVAHGHNVSPYYDPMLSKLIYYGKDRAGAIAGLRQALDEYVIEGVQHNAKLVQSVLREPDFQAGDTPTSFLPTHYPDGFHGVQLTAMEENEFAVAGAMIAMRRMKLMQQATLAGGKTDHDNVIIVRLGGQFGDAYQVEFDGEDADTSTSIAVQKLNENGHTIGDSKHVFTIDAPLDYRPVDYLARVNIDQKPRTLQVLREKTTGEIEMQMYGAIRNVLLQSPREYELSRKYMLEPQKVCTAHMVLSPMPGLLISYAVKPGDHVEIGQELCIVESMKMQNMIRSPREGVIESCNSKEGDSLKVDQVILTFVD
jgi:propionyl-CoA carboxylase alpha chain